MSAELTAPVFAKRMTSSSGALFSALKSAAIWRQAETGGCQADDDVSLHGMPHDPASEAASA